MRIPTKDIPTIIMDQCNLAPLVNNKHVLVEIQKGMYGLPQAGILANECLIKHLTTYGYHATVCTPSQFQHKTRPVCWNTSTMNMTIYEYTFICTTEIMHKIQRYVFMGTRYENAIK
jgi:hypothetical protein